MTSKSFFQTMTDGTEICVNRWLPEDDPKAVIVIVHGMAEHSLRYDRTASFFVDAGFAVSAHDQRGHGKTAQKQVEKGEVGFGYLCNKNGHKKIVEDLHEIVCQVKNEFPSKKIFVLGHSWGSFVSQSYIENYGNEIDGCLLLGTRGPNALEANGGLILADLLYLFGQKKRTSYLLGSIAFNGYLSRIKDSRTEYDWLSKDKAVVDMYMNDDWCGFSMTTGFYHELFKLFISMHKMSNIKKIPVDLPVFIAAGKEDPVGAYGKTVTKLNEIYKAHGIKDLSFKLYENDRHEILNETDSDEVMKEIILWITNHL